MAYRGISLFLALCALTGCTRIPSFGCIFFGRGCSADGSSGDENETPDWVKTFVGDTNSIDPTLRRQSPEQLTWTFDSTVKDECSPVSNTSTAVKCNFKDYLAVPLGGVDFSLTRVRDEDTKINTLVFAREEMEDKALYLSSQNLNVDPTDGYYDETNFWSEADPTLSEDQPAAPDASEETAANLRWRAQLEKTFWTFLSRPPTEAEVDLFAEHFLAAQGDNGGGWYEVLYVILMSEEFWHI